MPANNRLQMLLRIKIEATKANPPAIDALIADLAENLCAPEFLYDAITELRRDDQVTFVAVENASRAILTEKGRLVLDFDKLIIARIIDIAAEQEVASKPVLSE